MLTNVSQKDPMNVSLSGWRAEQILHNVKVVWCLGRVFAVQYILVLTLIKFTHGRVTLLHDLRFNARCTSQKCNAWIRTELGKEICESAPDLEIFISSSKILIDAKNTGVMFEKVKVVPVPNLHDFQAITVVAKF